MSFCNQRAASNLDTPPQKSERAIYLFFFGKGRSLGFGILGLVAEAVVCEGLVLHVAVLRGCELGLLVSPDVLGFWTALFRFQGPLFFVLKPLCVVRQDIN